MIDSYKDLDLEHYLALREIDTEALDEIEVQVAMIAVLSDCTEEEVLDLPLAEYRSCVGRLAFLLDEPKVSNPPKSITVCGRTLTVLTDPKDFTTGQYIDFTNYLREGEKNLTKTLTTLLIPKGEKYGDTPAEEMEKIVLSLPIEFVLSLTRFFFLRSKHLIVATLTSLVWTLKRMVRKEKEPMAKEKLMKAMKETVSLRDSVRNGDGFHLLMRSRTPSV